MMRKLAVTVFAMSLTLVGCGSSSTSKKDAAGDAAGDVGAQKDTISASDTIAPDTGTTDGKVADVAADISVTGDTATNSDVTADTTPVADTRDSAVPDNRQPDVIVRLDVAVTDAPADSAPVNGDAGHEVGDAQAD